MDKELEIGEWLPGQYQIKEVLGRGAMGCVYKAWRKTSGIDVAIKMVPPEVARVPREMEEIRENFKDVQGLKHPNIASVNHLEKIKNADGTVEYFLVMEFVPGFPRRLFPPETRLLPQRSVFAGAPRQMNRPVFTYRNLYEAYLCCRKNKRLKRSSLAFEINAEENLALLLEELKTRTYQPQPSVCFVTESPKPREIFAAGPCLNLKIG